MATRQPLPELTPEEEDLALRIGFDESILGRLKARHIFEFRQLTVWGVENTHPVEEPAAGLVFDAFEERADYLVRHEREPLARRGYQIFLAELASDDRAARVAVIRATDPYDMLRTMRTADRNGDKTTEDVIAHLKQWEQRYPFDLWGANEDWVLARFRKLPEDMLAFAQEVIAFAPDVYGQADWEDEEHFARALRRERGFYLWWD
jgi:hypothetical protein